jgi:peptidoglycan/LPS O-acetylase OafA/YrhL
MSTHASMQVRATRIDALRGCAALMVIGFHANGLVAATGTAAPSVLASLRSNLDSGVELFFVLSGYLIAMPFLRALTAGTGRPRLGAYALRRAARILPGYWLALSVAMTIAVRQPGAAPAGWALLPHLVLVQGLVPGEVFRPLTVAWTLSVEAVFYAAVPLASMLLLARRRRWSIRSLALLTGAAWASSAALAAAVAAAAPTGAWSQVIVSGPPGVLCQFCPGVLVALLQLQREAGRPGLARAVSHGRRLVSAGALIWVLSLALTWHGGSGLGLVARNQVAGIGFAAVLAGVLALRGSGGRLTRGFARLGTVSYGLYLWHWLVFQFLLSAGLRFGFAGLTAVNWTVAWLVLAMLTLPVAYVNWRFVEAPAIRWAASRLAARQPHAVPTEAVQPLVA